MFIIIMTNMMIEQGIFPAWIVYHTGICRGTPLEITQQNSKDDHSHAITAWDSERVKGVDLGKRDTTRKEPIQRKKCHFDTCRLLVYITMS